MRQRYAAKSSQLFLLIHRRIRPHQHHRNLSSHITSAEWRPNSPTISRKSATPAISPKNLYPYSFRLWSREHTASVRRIKRRSWELGRNRILHRSEKWQRLLSSQSWRAKFSLPKVFCPGHRRSRWRVVCSMMAKKTERQKWFARLKPRFIPKIIYWRFGSIARSLLVKGKEWIRY